MIYISCDTMETSDPIKEFIQESLAEAGKYAAQLRRVKIPGIDKELAKTIIKYLVFNSFYPRKCSLRAMERELKIPYSRIRKIVKILTEEGILEQVSTGRASIVRVVDLERAFIRGYLDSISPEKLLTFIIMSIPPSFRVGELTPTQELIRSMPKIPETLPYSEELMRTWGIIELVSGIISALVIIRDLEHLVQKSSGKLDQDLVDRLKLMKKRLKERRNLLVKLGGKHIERLLLNEERIEKILEIIWVYNLEEEVRRLGGALLELPFLRMTMSPTPFEIAYSKRIIEKELGKYKGLVESDKVRPLQHIPYTDPGYLWISAILYLKLSKDRPRDLYSNTFSIAKYVAEKTIEIYLDFYKQLLREIEEHGLDYLFNQKWKGLCTNAHILFESIVMKYVAILGMCSGARVSLIEEAAKVAFTLEKISILNYKGRRVEGKDVFSWAMEKAKRG